ncbi:MAG: type II toxin-antitoxin system VapC family toxin [Thermoplasmata archaeon]
MSVLDTDFLVGLLRGDPDALRKLRGLAEEGDTVVTTVINACELYRGAFLSRAPSSARDKVERLLRGMEQLDLASALASSIGEVSADMLRRGTPIGDFDTIIGVMARDAGQPLITRNVGHFGRIEDLVVDAW